MGVIEIKGISLYAYHGCFDEEKIIGNHFKVDVTMETSLEEAALTDDLSKTINYQKVYDLVKAEMEIPSKLLEHVAGRIINTIHKNFPAISHAKVRVSKLHPSLGGEVEFVGVELTS